MIFSLQYELLKPISSRLFLLPLHHTHSVEVKYSDFVTVFKNWKKQLVAYALLLEKRFGKEVKKGVLYFPKQRKKLIVYITAEDKKFVMKDIKEIRKLVKSEKMPRGEKMPRVS